MGTNLSLFLEEVGRITCTFVGLDLLDEHTLCYNDKTFLEKMESVTCKLSSVEWISVFTWKKIKDTFIGKEAEVLQW